MKKMAKKTRMKLIKLFLSIAAFGWLVVVINAFYHGLRFIL
jgi:hypothetical protein